ncbi:unnamed protein product, partial [Ectocarpus fasciculatus]
VIQRETCGVVGTKQQRRRACKAILWNRKRYCARTTIGKAAGRTRYPVTRVTRTNVNMGDCFVTSTLILARQLIVGQRCRHPFSKSGCVDQKVHTRTYAYERLPTVALRNTAFSAFRTSLSSTHPSVLFAFSRSARKHGVAHLVI